MTIGLVALNDLAINLIEMRRNEIFDLIYIGINILDALWF